MELSLKSTQTISLLLVSSTKVVRYRIVEYIIAGYGTRQIDVSEWDKPLPDDPEGLHSVLAFEVSLATDEQLFHKSNLCQHDFDVLDKLKLPYNNKNNNIWIQY